MLFRVTVSERRGLMWGFAPAYCSGQLNTKLLAVLWSVLAKDNPEYVCSQNKSHYLSPSSSDPPALEVRAEICSIMGSVAFLQQDSGLWWGSQGCCPGSFTCARSAQEHSISRKPESENLLRGHLFSFLLRASWIAVKGMSVIIAVEQWSVINYSFSDCVLPASFSYHKVNLECKKDTSPAGSKEEGRICPLYFLPEVSFSLWRSVFECGLRSIFNNWFGAEPATSVLNSVLSLLLVCAEVFWDWISWGREQAWWNPEQETEIPKSFSLKLMAIFWLWYTLRPASSLLELGGEFPAEQAFWCISLTFSIDKRHL